MTMTNACRMTQTGMKITRMRKKQLQTGTTMLSSNHPAASLLAQLNTARTRTSLTRTQGKGATNCTLRKEKERHPKVGILFFSLKVPKARAKVKEKAKGSQAKAKATAKEKG
jgi:hypothetical protein